MSTVSTAFRTAASALCLLLAACGGDGGSEPDPPAPTPVAVTTAMVGPGGGTVTGEGGAQVVVPPGALAQDVALSISQPGVGAPVLPTGATGFGPVLTLTPHGTQFKVPVLVSVPFDAALVPAGSEPALYKTLPGEAAWEPVTGTQLQGGTLTAAVRSFSSFIVASPPPLTRDDPVREWSFALFPGSGMGDTRFDDDRQVGGRLEEVATYGPTAFDAAIVLSSQTLPFDNLANGYVFGSANGVTYGVFAEAPSAKLGGPEPIGSITRLKQTQSYIKNSDTATLSFTLTDGQIDLIDFGARAPASRLLEAEVLLSVGAYTDGSRSNYFFYTAGRAFVRGSKGFYAFRAQDESFSQRPLWDTQRDFDFDHDTRFTTTQPAISCVGSRGRLKLKRPRTYAVDLSGVRVGQEFTLRVDTHAKAINRRGGFSVGDCEGTYASAFLRDPLKIGGVTVTHTGIAATNRPQDPPPVQVVLAPAACVPGPAPDPAAGALQFEAPTFAVSEAAGAVPTVAITRSGGSKGAVTATLRTSDGTAQAGLDYTPVAATVFFTDGELGQRIVEVPTLPNTAIGGNKTVLLQLVEPGGCAALGAQASAVLTIEDDEDANPPAPSGAGLDTTFGSNGKAVAANFGGSGTAMAVQADGKIVMTGGASDAFQLARFRADGQLDTGFGSGGLLRTDLIDNAFVQETPRAFTIQADGRIVVVGDTRSGSPFSFAIARYLADGSLDASFGTGGTVLGGVTGRAFAVAIQPDGRILVAGDDTATENFRLARYLPDGRLDPSFGSGGQVLTDIAGGPDLARNLVVQPDGAIVVSGTPIGNTGPTGVARYLADGRLDGSFGTGGKLLVTAARVGEGLALQPDGKLVLVGDIDVAAPSGTTTQFAVVRLNADGSLDAGFGQAGLVTTAFTALGDGARAVTLQADGRILVAGLSSRVNANFALARYNADGTLDTGFLGGTDGRTVLDFFLFADAADDVAVLPDGKIVLGGFATANVAGSGYALARFTP
jgi:uncharacterized delta-60 repeat protein